MYVPHHFRVPDDEVRQLLHHHGAGHLITATPDAGLLATMLPFVYDPHAGTAGGLGRLHGHLARANDQWRHEVVGEALVVLGGPDSYVTPRWYASKGEHGRVVPTWNYLTAHVYGRLRVRDDVEYVRRVVEQLTAKHESGAEHPWSVADAPAAYVEGQLRGVVGIELEITRVEAKAKLSQNRSEADVAGVVRGLRERGAAADPAMADLVEGAARGRD